MKKLYITTIMSVLLAFSGVAQITCNAAFSFTPDPSSSLKYNFGIQPTLTGASVGSGFFNRTRFYFGDGGSRWDSLMIGLPGGFSYQYNSPGTYALMMEQEVIDSANGNVVCTSYAYDTIQITNGANCSANFTTSLASAGSPVVTFQNNSLNGQSSMFNRFYSWNFGDGNSSTTFSPTHTYASVGNYQVTLSTYALDTNGIDTLCSSSMSKAVQAGAVDTCGAWFSSSVDPATLVANFRGYSSVYVVSGNRTVTDYYWDFGDGNTASGSRFINHTYAQMGTYSVKLVTEVRDSITQAFVCADTLLQSVYVGYPAPSCRARYVIDSVNTSATNFNIYNTSKPVSNHPVYSVSYNWDFGDSTSSNQAFPTHTFQGNGPFTVCLTVTATDSLNRTCSDMFCRQLGIDSLGNVIYKNTGFTLNVLDPAATVGQKEHEVLDVKIYPNPASDFVKVEGLIEGAEWSLYNIQGAQITSGYLEAGDSKINLGNKQQGLYVLTLKSGNTIKSVKLSII